MTEPTVIRTIEVSTRAGGVLRAGEIGDELGIGNNLLIGSDGAVEVGCHTSLYLRQSIDAPGGGVLVVEQVCARVR